MGILNFIPIVSNINARQDLLSRTIGTRSEEDHSHYNALVILSTVVTVFVTGAILELIVYLLFTYKVVLGIYS